jgi:tryptophan synthase alpha chain
VKEVRGDLVAPIVLFTYANPVLRFGQRRFAAQAAAAGVDGVLVLDLPIEEAAEMHAILDAAGLDMIFLLSPTTTEARIVEACRAGSGFLYAVSRLGVTGTRTAVAEGAQALVERIRSHTTLPIALGFGISRPEHVRQVGCWADAAVVGSGLVQVIADESGSTDVISRVTTYIKWLKGEPGAARGEP